MLAEEDTVKDFNAREWSDCSSQQQAATDVYPYHIYVYQEDYIDIHEENNFDIYHEEHIRVYPKDYIIDYQGFVYVDQLSGFSIIYQCFYLKQYAYQLL